MQFWALYLDDHFKMGDAWKKFYHVAVICEIF
jgi:hypothetical protein